MFKPIKENDLGDRMYTGQSYIQGGGGSGVDTFSSPDVSQTPKSFSYVPNIAGSQSNITAVPPVDYDNKPMADPRQFEKDVEEVKTKVTPDEVIAGIQYELKKMVYKRKDLAKILVVANLKRDPKYYSKLHMLNIDDDDIEPAQAPFIPTQNPYQSEPVLQYQDYRTDGEKAIAEIMKEMAQKKHEKRYPKH
jgi:hypothetical protein